MFKRYKNLLSAGAMALVAAMPAVCHADAAKTLGVAGRALAFLENGPTGRVVMAVVFDPAKPGSVAEKNAIMAALGAGYAAGPLTLVGKPVEVSAVGGVSGVQVLYVTTGVSYGAVGGAAKAKKLIAISGDPACAASGGCVMSVTTEPKVDITVNRATAAAVGATFKAAFRMMIHEI